MSRRPVSAEELIRNNTPGIVVLEKPRFISKLERTKLAILRQQQQSNKLDKPAKRKLVVETEEETFALTPVKRNSSKKFNFDWNLDQEDTSTEVPLLEEKSKVFDVIRHEKHWSEKRLEEMNVRDWRIFKEDFNINSKGGHIDNPLRRWKESQIPEKLLDVIIKDLKYQTPTPIQRATIPLALNHRDVVGIAETGSGKTLAYLIPLLSYLLQIDSNYMEFEHQLDASYNNTLGLILAPTRELALQISAEATKFGEILGFNVVTIIGGHQYEESIHSIRNSVHIVVATPGRLVDSIERNIISLKRCYYFILDEVDRMIDMGFEKPLQFVLDKLPDTAQLNTTIDLRIFNIPKKITLMFTATMSPSIEKMTKNYLVNPGYLSVGNSGEATENIEQQFEYLGESAEDFDHARFTKLLNTLKHHKRLSGQFSVIIFANFKRVCDVLSTELLKSGFKDNVVIHGSKSQESRESAIAQFKSKESTILIATDVAARGLDVPNVSLVVNFQMVNKFDEYIHRIGRTGRAGKTGISYTFLDDSNVGLFLELKKFLVKGRKKVPDWLLKQTQSQILRD